MADLVVVLFVRPQVCEEGCVYEPRISPADRPGRLSTDAFTVKSDGASCAAHRGAPFYSPLHKRVRLVALVATCPRHSHLVPGFPLRQAWVDWSLWVRESNGVRYCDKLRTRESAGEQREREVLPLVDQLKLQRAFPGLPVARRIVGEMILFSSDGPLLEPSISQGLGQIRENQGMWTR